MLDTKSKNSDIPSQTDVTSNDSVTANTAVNAEDAANNGNVIACGAITNNANAPDNPIKETGATIIAESQKPWSATETQQSAQDSFSTQQSAQTPFNTQPAGSGKKRSFFTRKKNQPENSNTPSSTSKPSTRIAILLMICSGITIAFLPGAKARWYHQYGNSLLVRDLESIWSDLQDSIGLCYLVVLAILALLAILLPFFKKLRENSTLIKHFPAELAILVIPGGLLAQLWVIWLCYQYAFNITVGTEALYIAFTFCICAIIYGIWLLAVLSLLQIPDMGIARYLREKSFFIRNGSRIGSAVSRTVRQFVHDLTTINLGEGSDRWLFKVVLANYLALLICCLFFGAFLFAVAIYYYSLVWCIFWVAAGLLVYSVILFFIFRRYVNRVKAQYQTLLDAAGQLAQGNLQSETLNTADSTSGLQSETSNTADSASGPRSQASSFANGTGDLGVFEPIRQALTTVNAGFRKAVDLEMRSQAMKTELITNVSHDLKTPLTAIITYVNLLKDESITAEERREYVDILDRKSLRLKKLIEDLFEVSKAASGNIEIKKSQVDLAEMVRQAVAEQQDRLQAAGIDCRVSTPYKRVTVSGTTGAAPNTESTFTSGNHSTFASGDDAALTSGKGSAFAPGQDSAFTSGGDATLAFGNGSSISYDRVLLMLDSERTYRILENLLINVSKYALPGTRAWVQLEIIESEAVITVKNTSAAELDFDISTLTDRFVRGDKSRNTEGSGLGLAIVKNFAELQGGTFEIMTDGDLFKAIVRFPCGISCGEPQRAQ